jgi:Flp pilus assembly protein TadG
MKRRSNERGQAMVEFTLIATVLATLLLAVFQFGVALSNYISVADAARAAARKAVTDTLPSTQAKADAIASSEGSSGHTCVANNWCTTFTYASGWAPGMPLTATVTAPYSIKIFGLSVASGTLKHSVTMRLEAKAAA